MKFDYKALIRLMKKSYKGGGIKIIRTERELRDCFFLSGAPARSPARSSPGWPTCPASGMPPGW